MKNTFLHLLNSSVPHGTLVSANGYATEPSFLWGCWDAELMSFSSSVVEYMNSSSLVSADGYATEPSPLCGCKTMQSFLMARVKMSRRDIGFVENKCYTEACRRYAANR